MNRSFWFWWDLITVLSQSGPSPITVTSTLDRYPNRYLYSGHHHNVIGTALPGNIGTLPLSIPKHDNSFSIPAYHHDHTHPHVNTASNESSNSLSMGSSSSHKISNYPNSDDFLHHSSFPIEPSGTFPRKKEAQRIRIPSNQSVTSRSSTERFELRNSPMPKFDYEVSIILSRWWRYVVRYFTYLRLLHI